MNVKMIGMAALALALAACGNDDAPQNNRVELNVTSNITVNNQVQETGTRAVDNEWEGDDAIGIFAVALEGQDNYANMKYITTADNLGAFASETEANTIYLPTNENVGRDFVAYYPYSSMMSGSEYAINLTDQTKQNSIDFMVSDRANGDDSKVTGITKADPTAKFRFHHKLAKLRLNFVTGNGFTGDNSELAGLKVEITGQPTTGTFDVLTSEAVTATNNGQTIILLTAADGKTAEGVVFPSENYTGMQIVVTVDGHATPYKWDLSASTSAQKFEVGKEYIYNITINKTAIEVTSTIEPWQQGNNGGESGSAE